ncbi:uncharacterized protein LOC144915083 [Branchiostoma floridae x Branchiostoma belcheri]
MCCVTISCFLQKFPFSVLSGQGSTVPHSGFGLRVPEWATEEKVLEMAAEKLIAMRKIDSVQGHLLLCEGDGSWLKYVPGTKKPFVIRDYMEFRDMLPSKLHLYVMTRMDYIVLQKSKTKQCRDKHWKEARLPADQTSAASQQGCRALAIIYVHITEPYWRLVESNNVHILDLTKSLQE